MTAPLGAMPGSPQFSQQAPGSRKAPPHEQAAMGQAEACRHAQAPAQAQ